MTSTDVREKFAAVRDTMQTMAAIKVQLKTAEKDFSDALAALVTAAGTNTVELDGTFYQVRSLKGSNYLCELKEKPKGRPKRVAPPEAISREDTTGVATEVSREESSMA